MNGTTTVITGGASGLGLAMAHQLAEAGHRIVLIGRDPTRTREAAERLHTSAPVTTYSCDLEQRSQVRALAAELAAGSHPVDNLINNAGAAFPRYERTTDGAERTYALNHHAPFLLTHALLATGTLTPQARIINMSSFVEKRGKLDPADPDVDGTSWSNRFYHQINVYATSKLLGLLATRALAHRLPHGMSAYNANPGMVKGTAMNRNAGGVMRLTAPLLRPFATTPDQGVQTPVQLATAPTPPQPSGGFFTKSNPDTPSLQARNDTLAATVYTKTAALLDIEPLTGYAHPTEKQSPPRPFPDTITP
ncbi:SDR family NAD(P)-dependent oxidoreductase [Salininema proteolyticum]|uniref:SDR family NAD(P)-dependent oxidoreductase n=1 Tax=Salininema proteolyticum TaxID=1607685 RepID=A0ABV8TU79_9ACTN